MALHSPVHRPERPLITRDERAERLPRDFGNGWKGVVSQKLLGRDGPAASLASPRPMGPRPEWSWHGYDNYNQGRDETSDLNPSAGQANAAEDPQ